MNIWSKIIENNFLPCYPEARAAHTCNKISNKIFLFGGWNGSEALNTMYIYYITDNQWIKVKQKGEIPKPRNNHVSCSFDTTIFIHGGHDGSDWLDDLHLFDTTNFHWREIILQHKPLPRACHTLSRVLRKLYMFGGYNGEDSYNSIEVFDLETYLWSKPLTKGMEPTPRNAHSATVVGKSIYYFGGYRKSVHFNDLFIFNTVHSEWLRPELSGDVPSGLRGHTADLIYNKIYIFGGYDGERRYNDLFIFSINEFEFSRIVNSSEIVKQRQRHSSSIISFEKILYFGGYKGEEEWLNDIDVLNVLNIEKNILSKKLKLENKFDFSKIINKEEFSDIKFKIGDRYLYGHKAILCSRCDYFRHMLSDDLKESKQDYIEIKDFSFTTFLKMIEFIYTGQINEIYDENLIELFVIGDTYSLESLKRICEEYLYFSINEYNVFDILIASYVHNSCNLENFCIDYILSNKNKIQIDQEISKLSEYPNIMIKIMKAISNKK